MSTLGIALLFAIGLVLVFTEVIMPGIIFGLTGLGCIVASIVLAFSLEETFGWLLTGLAAACVPLFLFAMMKVFKKYLALKKSEKGYSSSEVGLEQYRGKEGVAMAHLRPSGIADIEGQRVDVIADGEMIPKDTRITVADIQGNRVIVRAKKG